jgi:hypothetical protein
MNGIGIDLRSGNHVGVLQSWRSPMAGCAGVVSTIDPNDPYGTYLVQFEDVEYDEDREISGYLLTVWAGLRDKLQH